MSSFERLENISIEIAKTSGILRQLENDKFAIQMADKSYRFEKSILEKKEQEYIQKLSDLFEELKLVYKAIKGK